MTEMEQLDWKRIIRSKRYKTTEIVNQIIKILSHFVERFLLQNSSRL